MKRKAIIGLVIVVVLVLVVCIWYSAHRSSAPIKEEPIPVKLATVQLKTLPVSVSAIGTVIAPNDVTLMAKQPGQITSIDFKPGQLVKKGQILFTINDTQEQAVALEKKASLTNAKADYERYLKLKNAGANAYSEEQFDQMKATYLAAKGNYNWAVKAVNDTRIKAPFGGTISVTEPVRGQTTSSGTSLSRITQLTVGSYVKVGQQLADVVDLKDLQVQYSLPQEDLSKTKIGQAVQFRTDSYAGQVFNGKVIYRSPSLSSQTRTFEVRASLDNHAGLLSPGMLLEVDQIVNPARRMMVIPAIAIIPDLEGYHVFVIQKGKVLSKPVKVGKHYGPEVELLSGLKPGDTLIGTGMNKVVEGDQVKVVK